MKDTRENRLITYRLVLDTVKTSKRKCTDEKCIKEHDRRIRELEELIQKEL